MVNGYAFACASDVYAKSTANRRTFTSSYFGTANFNVRTDIYADSAYVNGNAYPSDGNVRADVHIDSAYADGGSVCGVGYCGSE